MPKKKAIDQSFIETNLFHIIHSLLNGNDLYICKKKFEANYCK